jgi:DNA-binding transcriptional ArsR family regulator
MMVCEALADDTRVKIVELLAQRDLTAGEIAANFDVSRPAISRHLRVLREGNLVTVTNDATRRIYRLDPQPLRDLQGWLTRNERMIEARLDKLGAHLDDMARKRKAKR